MTDRCEPPEHLRDRDGRHWLNGGAEDFPADWNAHFRGWWAVEHHLRGHSTQETAAMGYRYISPVAGPEEVEALRAERDEAWKFQGEAHRLRTGNKLLADTVRAWGWENRKQESNGELIGRALHEMHAEITTLRARVETLEAAMRKIANSGIETFAIHVIGGDDIRVECSSRFAHERDVAAIMATARAALEEKP